MQNDCDTENQPEVLLSVSMQTNTIFRNSRGEKQVYLHLSHWEYFNGSPKLLVYV